MSKYTTYDFSESLNRLKSEHGYSEEDVKSCLKAFGEQGEYGEWSGGFVLLLKDGKVAILIGWCDTTGWGCQNDIEAGIIADSERQFAAEILVHKLHSINPMLEKLDDVVEWDDNPVDLNRFLEGRIDEFDHSI